MGKGGGADEARKSINLKTINNFYMSLCNSKNNVAKNVMIPTITTYSTKTMVVLNISGSLTVLFNIFLIILPRWVAKPVLITIANVCPFLVSSTFEP